MIRVGVADDHAIVRAALRRFLEEQGDLVVVGEAATGREAIDLVRKVPMDVLVLDISMPGQSGIDALAMIRAKAPQVGVLVLSGYAEDQYAPTLVRHGIRGFLNKECDPAEIVVAIRTIADGRRHFSSSLGELLLEQMDRSRARAPHELLTDREFQVFLKLAAGQSAGEVAAALSLSVKTISTYRMRLLEKMELSTNSDLTYYALKHKLLQ